MKKGRYLQLFFILAALFGFVGALIGAWLSVAAPELVYDYTLKGLVLGISIAGLIVLFAKGSSNRGEDQLAEEPLPTIEGHVEDRERRQALRYQRFDFAASAAQTAGAIFLIAVAFTVMKSSDHRSPIFFLFVAYPAITIASGLMFRSWGWVGRLLILTLYPAICFMFGLYILVFEPSKEGWWGALAVGLGFYAASDSIKRYKKVKALIDKYPLSAKGQSPESN
jgi:hypothetical protein